jgi:hypothetical protein
LRKRSEPYIYRFRKNIGFHSGLGLQLFGFTAVGLCQFAGLKSGNYGKIELAQFILGMFSFYIGTYIKNKGGKAH